VLSFARDEFPLATFVLVQYAASVVNVAALIAAALFTPPHYSVCPKWLVAALRAGLLCSAGLQLLGIFARASGLSQAAEPLAITAIAVGLPTAALLMVSTYWWIGFNGEAREGRALQKRDSGSG
jgi:hypothetical protein